MAAAVRRIALPSEACACCRHRPARGGVLMGCAIAIDPGTTGAVALVRGRSMLGWAAWIKRTRGYDYLSSTMSKPNRVDCLPRAIGAALVHLPPDADLTGCVTALEGLKPHGPKRGYTALCESAGIARAELFRLVADPHRPLYGEWVPSVLGVPGNSPNAQVYANAAWGLGPDPDGRREVFGRYPLGRFALDCPRPPDWALPHVADAGCIAIWSLHHTGALVR